MLDLTNYHVQGLINPTSPDHLVTSRYADTFWLPRLGPSSMALLRWISYQPNTTATVTLHDLSHELGLGGGHRQTTRSLERAISRLSDNHLARRTPGRIELSLTVPTLTARQIAALDTSTKALHTRLIGTTTKV